MDTKSKPISFKMDLDAVRQWLEAWKKFPHASRKWTAKMEASRSVSGAA